MQKFGATLLLRDYHYSSYVNDSKFLTDSELSKCTHKTLAKRKKLVRNNVKKQEIKKVHGRYDVEKLLSIKM